jgi:hypothetical protein
MPAIVLFVYNRPQHTLLTLDSLSKNSGVADIDLFIYADGPKKTSSSGDIDLINQTRKICKKFNSTKNVEIIERGENLGLAQNIILGVSEIIKKYGEVIVLEDDIVTSPYFLIYMNKMLSYYKDNKKVWHISGWNYPIKINIPEDVFLWRTMNCWGWATWSDRWQYFEKNPTKLQQEFDNKMKHTFNLDGVHCFWTQIESNLSGRINTWAIFWYATIFKSSGLCVNPKVSLVRNIGHDGSGVHCGKNELLSSQYFQESQLDYNLPTIVIENQKALKLIKKYYKGPLYLKVFRKVKRFVMNLFNILKL